MNSAVIGGVVVVMIVIIVAITSKQNKKVIINPQRDRIKARAPHSWGFLFLDI